MIAFRMALACLSLLALMNQTTRNENKRPRARDAGVAVGILPTGKLNAITDVAGVRVGHSTLIRGDNVRTGVTAMKPCPLNARLRFSKNMAR